MTEEENIAKLLRPRIKVIAPMPFGKFEVGDILIQMMVRHHPKEDSELMWRRVSGIKHWGGQSVGIPMIKNPDHYPHLFKRLEWWEDRKPEEMPEYVKWKYMDQVFKITELTKNGNHLLSTVLPATSQQYLEYINKKDEA